MAICASSPSAHICTFADIEVTAQRGGATGIVVIRRDPAAELLVGAALAAMLALWAPLPLAVLGLVLVGPAHTVLELRYVLGRFRSVLSGPFLQVAVGIVTVVAAARLAGAPAPRLRVLGAFPPPPLAVACGRPGRVRAPARRIEIVAAFALLAVAVVRGRRGGAFALPLAAAFVLAMRSPAWFALVLLHLHNLVPAAFLWEWSARRAVRAVTVLCLGVVP